MIESLEHRRCFADFALAQSLVLTSATTSLSGHVFFDKDRSGTKGDKLQQPDVGQSGVVVYVDLDRDGRRDKDEPASTTTADGSFAIWPLPDKALNKPLRLELDGTDWHVTTPSLATIDGTLPDIGVFKQRATATIAVAPAFQFSSALRKVLLSDDAKHAPVPMSGVTLYLDLNHDGKRQSTEPRATSTSSSSDGFVSATFKHLMPGKYDVRIDQHDVRLANGASSIAVRVMDREQKTAAVHVEGTQTVLVGFPNPKWHHGSSEPKYELPDTHLWSVYFFPDPFANAIYLRPSDAMIRAGDGLTVIPGLPSNFLTIDGYPKNVLSLNERKISLDAGWDDGHKVLF